MHAISAYTYLCIVVWWCCLFCVLPPSLPVRVPPLLSHPPNHLAAVQRREQRQTNKQTRNHTHDTPRTHACDCHTYSLIGWCWLVYVCCFVVWFRSVVCFSLLGFLSLFPTVPCGPHCPIPRSRIRSVSPFAFGGTERREPCGTTTITETKKKGNKTGLGTWGDGNRGGSIGAFEEMLLSHGARRDHVRDGTVPKHNQKNTWGRAETTSINAQ